MFTHHPTPLTRIPENIRGSQHMIIGRNIHRSFGDNELTTHVLKGVSLTIREGEFLAIMGKSGAGKSTLLYQLSALDTPTEGSITVNGVNISALTERERVSFRLHTLGYVFQDYALIPDLTARENVFLPLLMRNVDWHTAVETANTAIDAVGLAGKYAKMPMQLSGGEQQRIAVARAIAGKPKIVFADEPTANLDSSSGRAIISLLKSLHEQGQTIIMVTHEEEYAERCDRIIYLEDGNIIKEERRAHTQETPAPEETKPEYVNPCYKVLNRTDIAPH